MSLVVDRRGQASGRNVSNRQRFLNRGRDHVKKAVDKAIREGNVADIGADGVDVIMPKEGIVEPFIHHGKGGVSEGVLPGNTDFIKGDRIPKPPGGGGGGQGKQASTDGSGEDSFTFHLSQEEFLNILFDDLELPNMVKKGLLDGNQTKLVRRGFVSQGPMNNLDVMRSKRKKIGRRIAAESPHNREIVDVLTRQIEILSGNEGEPDPDLFVSGKAAAAFAKAVNTRQKMLALAQEVAELKEQNEDALKLDEAQEMAELEQKLKELEHRKTLIPTWVESTDMQFRNHAREPVPVEKAVVVCMMDVSGSMTQEDKDQAKLFFFLLYKFIEREYPNTELVFIRHTQDAKEVDMEEFFYSRETGGTVVSTAFRLAKDIIAERYPPHEYNIYAAYASDGDNYLGDNPACTDIMRSLMPDLQAFFYTEIITPRQRDARYTGGDLWKALRKIEDEYEDNFFMGMVAERKDIVPQFREFLKKRYNFTGESVQNAAAFTMK